MVENSIFRKILSAYCHTQVECSDEVQDIALCTQHFLTHFYQENYPVYVQFAVFGCIKQGCGVGVKQSELAKFPTMESEFLRK